MKKILMAGVVAATMAFGAAQAQAATITGLWNTGVDATGFRLDNDSGDIDTHWTVVSSTSGAGYAGQNAVTYKHPAYAANDDDSKWVSLTGSGSPGSNTTIYRLTFDLTGLNAATAKLTGLFGGDNQATIYLNGQNTGQSTTVFSSLSTFTITSGFVAGVNTFDVELKDFGAPAAFRIDDFAGTADAVVVEGGVPEPATWALMIGGFGFAGATLRRRKAITAA